MFVKYSHIGILSYDEKFLTCFGWHKGTEPGHFNLQNWLDLAFGSQANRDSYMFVSSHFQVCLLC